MVYRFPNDLGYFGDFGGRFIPETLMSALIELEQAYKLIKKDKGFNQTLRAYLADYVGRPSPLYFAKNLSQEIGGARIYLKREDLLHTGAHKINNTMGQVLLAKRIGKKRVIAETGAGQHGVAVATACALLGLKCTVYMGTEDMRRQRMNLLRMRLLKAQVIGVESGSQTLKDAINEALRDWVTNVEDTYYCIGSVVGPHPYPMMVRDFQSVIGQETKEQIIKKEGRLPDLLVACVGGGSNAIGLFYPFINDDVEMLGVEAGGTGLDTDRHSASLSMGRPGVLHGSATYLLQDGAGQIRTTHSIAPGLDYPGVGPEHAYLRNSGRVQYTTATDQEAIQAFKLLSKTEGIIPALESAHAIAGAIKSARDRAKQDIIVVNLSGRGDKDLNIVEEMI